VTCRVGAQVRRRRGERVEEYTYEELVIGMAACMFINENEYRGIIKKIPVFCIDFVVKCGGKILLIRRTEEPLRDEYWVVGGRLYYGESLEESAKRIQLREIGRSFQEMKAIGFSNYRFENTPDSRALHTPTLLCLIEVEEMFVPEDSTGAVDHIWSDRLPSRLLADALMF